MVSNPHHSKSDIIHVKSCLAVYRLPCWRIEDLVSVSMIAVAWYIGHRPTVESSGLFFVAQDQNNGREEVDDASEYRNERQLNWVDWFRFNLRFFGHDHYANSPFTNCSCGEVWHNAGRFRLFVNSMQIPCWNPIEKGRWFEQWSLVVYQHFVIVAKFVTKKKSPKVFWKRFWAGRSLELCNRPDIVSQQTDWLKENFCHF